MNTLNKHEEIRNTHKKKLNPTSHVHTEGKTDTQKRTGTNTGSRKSITNGQQGVGITSNSLKHSITKSAKERIQFRSSKKNKTNSICRNSYSVFIYVFGGWGWGGCMRGKLLLPRVQDLAL